MAINKNTLKQAFLIFLMGLLSSCTAYDLDAWRAGHRAFVEPDEADKRVRIRVMADADTWVHAMPGSSSCFSSVNPKTGVILEHRLAVGVSSFNGRSLGMPPSIPNPREDMSKFEKAEFYAAAHQPIVFLWKYNERHFGGVISSCELMLTFTPEENQDYEVAFISRPKERICYANIISLTQPHKKVPFQKVGLCPDSTPPKP